MVADEAGDVLGEAGVVQAGADQPDGGAGPERVHAVLAPHADALLVGLQDRDRGDPARAEVAVQLGHVADPADVRRLVQDDEQRRIEPPARGFGRAGGCAQGRIGEGGNQRCGREPTCRSSSSPAPRAATHSTRLARLVAELRPADAVTVVADLARLPFYDADVESAGITAAVAQLRAATTAAALVVLVTPEYNGTVPGILGNAVDWLSRPPGQPALRGKPVLVLCASPTRYGGARAAEHLRAVLTRGATVLPAGLSVPTAHQRLCADEPDAQVLADLTELLAQPSTDTPGDLGLGRAI